MDHTPAHELAHFSPHSRPLHRAGAGVVLLVMAVVIALIQASTTASVGTAAAKDTPTPTAAVNPGATQAPIYAILLTPTPGAVVQPPSLQVPDLEKKIKDKKAFSARQVRQSVLPSMPGAVLAAEPPIPPELDASIAQFWAWLIGRQNEYRFFSGRYAQMLSTHIAATPADGLHAYPDGWYLHPSDQQYRWSDFNAIQFEPLPYSITVDTYSGPEGFGFTGRFQIAVDGVIWQKILNYGPESLRAEDWAPLVEVAP